MASGSTGKQDVKKPKLVDHQCLLCGAGVEVVEKAGGDYMRLIFECGGEVTMESIVVAEKIRWKRANRSVCGAADDEEDTWT